MKKKKSTSLNVTLAICEDGSVGSWGQDGVEEWLNLKEKDGFELKRYSGGGTQEACWMWAGMTKGEHQSVNIFYEGVKQKFRAAFLLGTHKKFQKTPNLVDKHGKILEKRQHIKN